MKRLPLFAALLLSAACSPDRDIASVGAAGLTFEKIELRRDHIAEGVAVADINKDGRLDLIAGPAWYEAPRWREHAIAEIKAIPKAEYSEALLTYALDVDGDEWIDIITFVWPGKAPRWWKNPGRTGEEWQAADIYARAGHESPLLADLGGDGAPELIFNDPEQRAIMLAHPDPAQPNKWRVEQLPIAGAVGAAGLDPFSHGMGVDDVDGDGRKDLIVEGGWYKAPADGAAQWQFFAAPFSLHLDGCGQMYANDFDGDGDADVLCTTSHNYSAWWIEQVDDPQKGEASWRRHMIDDTLSEMHALARTDLDDNGVPDFVTGKRYWAHNEGPYGDPGMHEPPVLRWYVYEPGAPPQWRYADLDQDSGVGNHLWVGDIDADGDEDIATANKNGVFLFLRSK